MYLHPKTTYHLGLEIAGISIAIQSFLHWEEEKVFTPFVKDVEYPDFWVDFQQTDTLPAIPDSIIHEDDCYRVHPDGKGGYLRSFFDAPRDLTPYAVAEYDYEEGKIQVNCQPKGAGCVSELYNSFFHIGFESMLIHRKRLCVHAACIETLLGGILFSGPSGIGKSTQAQLWCQYRGARQINGDRPILSKNQDSWLAWGSPYAGSSRCHINESCPVTAIVMLEQADSCSMKRLHPSEAFRAVWSGLTIHSWDKWFVEEACNLTIDLVQKVPVFKFCCTPDVAAVEYLEKNLRKECCL